MFAVRAWTIDINFSDNRPTFLAGTGSVGGIDGEVVDDGEAELGMDVYDDGYDEEDFDEHEGGDKMDMDEDEDCEKKDASFVL